MAIMKLTAFNGGMKGKVQGTIFQGSIAGQVVKGGLIDAVKAGSKLTKADAGRIIRPKANLTDLASSWKNLTDTQRTGWNSNAVNYPAQNKFGETYTPSGYQVYMSLNMALLNAGLSKLSDVPTPGVVIPAPSFTAAYSSIGHTLEIDNLTIPTGYTCTLYAARSLSKGRKPQDNFFTALYVFQIGDTFPFNISSYWSDNYGVIPNQGNIWFRLDIVNDNTGQKGMSYYFQLIY